MTTTVSHITATLGSKLLKNADRYFTNDDATILDEMIQNARRAGAGKLTFTADGVDLVISDDGKGLPSEKAGVLLALGDSNNDELVETAENAAGLGFFSLANFDVEVASQDWTMTVPKAAFTGAANATLQKTRGYKAGLSIRIRQFLKGKTQQAIAQLILNSTRYSTMVTELIDFDAPVLSQEPRDFVTDHTAGLPTATLVSHGVTVTVARSTRCNGVQSKVNFFGKIISHDLLKDVAIPQSEKIASLDDRGNVLEEAILNIVLVDVQDTSSLKLQLPQRQALIESEGLVAIRDMVRQAYAALLLQDGIANGLDITHPLRKRFADIPAPRLSVTSIDGERFISMADELVGRSSTVPLSQAFAMEEYPITNIDGSLLQSLLTSIEPAPFASDRLFDATDLSKAYPASKFGLVAGIDLVIANGGDEDIVRLSEASVRKDGTTFAEITMEEVATVISDAEIEHHFNKVVESLALRFVCSDPEGKQTVLAHPIAGMFFSDDCDTWTPTIIIARGHDGALPSMMINGIDWYSDDVEANSYDDQQSEHDRQYTRLVAAITGNEGANFLDEIRDRVRETLYQFQMDAIEKAGALNLKISIDPAKHGWDAVTIEKIAA